MSKEYTSTNIPILDRESIEVSPFLEVAIESEDNEDALTYQLGSAYYFRLYKYPDTLDPLIFTTNGQIGFIEASTTMIEDEEVSFLGTDSITVSREILANFSYELVGKALNINGEEPEGITFEVIEGIGENIIRASMKCYAFLKVSYLTRYWKYIISANEVGESIVTARVLYNDETLESSMILEFVEPQVSETCLQLQLQYGTISKETTPTGQAYIIPLSIWGTEIRSLLNLSVTSGTAKFQDKINKIYEEVLVSINGKVRASNYVSEILFFEKYTGYIGNVTCFNGTLYMDGIPESGVTYTGNSPVSKFKSGIPYGTGVFRIRYRSTHLLYNIIVSDSAVCSDNPYKVKGAVSIRNNYNSECSLVQQIFEQGGTYFVERGLVLILFFDGAWVQLKRGIVKFARFMNDEKIDIETGYYVSIISEDESFSTCYISGFWRE